MTRMSSAPNAERLSPRGMYRYSQAAAVRRAVVRRPLPEVEQYKTGQVCPDDARIGEKGVKCRFLDTGVINVVRNLNCSNHVRRKVTRHTVPIVELLSLRTALTESAGTGEWPTAVGAKRQSIFVREAGPEINKSSLMEK